MPQVKLTNIAHDDFQRLTSFLVETGAVLPANKVAKLLTQTFADIADNPNQGKVYQLVNGKIQGIREFKVRFGRSGYQFLYVLDTKNNTLLILTIKHYREKSYSI